MKKPSRVFLWGDNSLSRELASRLSRDYQVFWAAPGQPVNPESKVPLIPGCRLLRLQGTWGNFQLELEDQRGRQKIEADVVVICPEGEDGQELALAEALKKTEPSCFVVSFAGKPGAFARVIKMAAEAASRGHEVTVVGKDQLVGWGRGQLLMDLARTRGMRFVRGYVHKVEHEEGVFRVDLVDEQFPSLGIVRVVADHVFYISRESDYLGLPEEVIRLSRRRRQEDYPVGTLRRGVFVVTEGWGEPSLPQVLADVLQAAITRRPKKGSYKVRGDDCAFCLNCYRVCPHGAVVLGAEAGNLYRQAVFIDPYACQSCGICWAECPAMAIDVIEDAGAGKELLGVWACENAAGRLSEARGVECRLFPCAGAIGVKDMLAGFAAGLKTIYIFTCHKGKCQHDYGETRLKKRAARVNEMMGEMGLDCRVEVRPVSAQDGRNALMLTEAGERS